MKGLGILAVALLCIAAVWGCRGEGKRQTVKIGYLLCNSEQETRQRFAPLSRYLSEKTGVEYVMVPVEAADFEQRFQAGEFTFARINSLLHATVARELGATLLAGEKRGNFGSRTAGTIITRRGSGIEKLADLRGKTMAFGSAFAPAGYLTEYDLLLNAGIDPERDLGHYTTPRGSFKHEKLVYGTLYGAYDAAAVPLLDLETMIREGKIAADDVVILAKSDLIPYCTFVAAKGVDRQLLEKFRRALAELKPTDTVEMDGERIRVMKAAMIDGYEELVDGDYDNLRKIADRVGKHLNQP